MKQYFLSLINKPYPLPESRRNQLLMALSLSGAVFLFLFLLKPFSPRQTLSQAAFSGMVGGGTTFVVMLMHYLLLFPLFPRFFREERWTVGREIVWAIGIIISIGLANAFVIAFFDSFPVTLKNILLIIAYTAMVGVAPVTVSILINQARLLRRYQRAARALTHTLQQEAPARPAPVVTTPVEAAEEDTLITLTADNGKDPIAVAADDLLAITSADNYCKLYIQEAGAVKTVILRSSLKRLEGFLAGQAAFWRCHRTALVNLPAVMEVGGTAQGYRLYLHGLGETIPVSRSLNGELREKLGSRLP
jgi:hypothetical protein